MRVFFKKNYLIYFLLFLAASGAILITNISYDAEYQIAMGYRMLKGDIMITEMWEPHQTSAFLCALFMKLYIMVTGTTTGIVLYLNVVGYAIRAGISLFLYRMIRRTTGELPALIAGLLYMLISPKDLLIPEFSNMELWFGSLTALFLLQYFNHKKLWQLILSAVCLCLGVLSYPSFIIAYIVVIFILVRYSDNCKKDILVYTGVCALIGGSFVAYLLIQTDLETMLKCLSSALALEPTHTVSTAGKLWNYVKNIAVAAGTVAGIALIGFVIEFVRSYLVEKKTGEKVFSKERWMITAWYVLLIYFLVQILRVVNNGSQMYPLLGIILLGYTKRNILSEAEKRVYNTGLWIGFATLIATLLLSDHPFIQSVSYMHLAVCVSVLPLYRWYEQCAGNGSLRKYFSVGVQLFLLMIVFRCIYIHVPIYGRAQICSLSDELGLIRTGPALGIVTDEDGAARQRDSFAEFQEYITPGDTIWILGEPVDTLGYLYQDVEVGAPSVMSTPTYNEELLYYWELNPEKYPDVVILSSGFGTLSYELLKCEWLMNWLEEEYRAETVIDGNYWRYYYREAR